MQFLLEDNLAHNADLHRIWSFHVFTRLSILDNTLREYNFSRSVPQNCDCCCYGASNGTLHAHGMAHVVPCNGAYATYTRTHKSTNTKGIGSRQLGGGGAWAQGQGSAIEASDKWDIQVITMLLCFCCSCLVNNEVGYVWDGHLFGVHMYICSPGGVHMSI